MSLLPKKNSSPLFTPEKGASCRDWFTTKAVEKSSLVSKIPRSNARELGLGEFQDTKHPSSVILWLNSEAVAMALPKAFDVHSFNTDTRKKLMSWISTWMNIASKWMCFHLVSWSSVAGSFQQWQHRELGGHFHAAQCQRQAVHVLFKKAVSTGKRGAGTPRKLSPCSHWCEGFHLQLRNGQFWSWWAVC